MSLANTGDRLAEALREAAALARRWDDGAERLRASVIRPLSQLVADEGDEVRGSDRGGVATRLWELTTQVTALAGDDRAPSQLIEAAAALQELTLCEIRSRVAPDRPEPAQRLAELVSVAGVARPRIRVATDGPYLVTGAPRISNHLGVPIETRPAMALCRCGASARKPLCDGSHAAVGFTGAKDPDRVPDRRDSYPGTTVTVFDNRGLCQHSGFCTDRLNTVFHADSDPFVTPSGGRMDEIVAAVRACPSGALSFAVDGREAREQVDQAGRPEAIEVSSHGPYRITGGIQLTADDGSDVDRNEGASLEHYALCRCGHSRNKPFCSGMHWDVNFHDPNMSEDPTVFEWAGGYPALLRTTRIFYSKYVPQDPLLSPLFATMSPDHPERVASWLSEVFGGNGGHPFYSGTYGDYARMLSQHLGKQLTEEQRARWVTLMCQAANEAMMPNDAEFRAAFVSYLEWGSRLAVENSQLESHPPPSMPMPHWWWVADATPGSRVSALAPVVEPEPVMLPSDDEPISYATHIKSLFRTQDRESMKFAFDLWSYDHVSAHAEVILERVRAGTMPCDGAWPDDRVEAFTRWIQEGRQP